MIRFILACIFASATSAYAQTLVSDIASVTYVSPVTDFADGCGAYKTASLHLALPAEIAPATPMKAIAEGGGSFEQTPSVDADTLPLPPDQLNAVMTWIAAQVSAQKTPYCYKQSYGDGAGTSLVSSCPSGTSQDGAVCYPPCRTGFHGVADRCYPDCPSGYGDIGVSCKKPHSSSSCPSGFTNTLLYCTKPPSYSRGFGSSLNYACSAGLQRPPESALCYTPCRPGYNLVAPVCYQSCPAQQPVECGAGCTTSAASCASGTINMVTAPILLAMNFVPGAGVASGAAGEGIAVAQSAEAAAETSEFAAAAAKLAPLYQAIKAGFGGVKSSIVAQVGGEEKWAELLLQTKMINGLRVDGNAEYKLIANYRDTYRNNFADLTTEKVASTISEKFSPQAALQIEQAWALSHLLTALQSDGFVPAEAATSVASTGASIAASAASSLPRVAYGLGIVSGIAGVANAYAKPICGDSTPFPNVNPLH